MSFEHLPANIERGEQSYASEMHITHDEALLKIIETGLNAIKLPPRTNDLNSAATTREFGYEPLSESDTALKDAIVAEAMEARRALNIARSARRQEWADARPETPDALIGFLRDAPEVAENIRTLAYQRRSKACGS